MYVGDGRFMATKNVALSVRVITRKESRRIAKAAFAYANARKMDVTAVHKGNVLKHGEELFLETCQKVANDYSDVGLETAIVDAFAMDLIVNPTDYDVVVTTNLFGDNLSDEAAGVIGGLGLAPGLNHSNEYAMAQAIHGAAPDIAGENIANPTSMILSASLLLDWLGCQGADGAAETAMVIDEAVTQTINSGIRIPDISGSATTDEFINAVIKYI